MYVLSAHLAPFDALALTWQEYLLSVQNSLFSSFQLVCRVFHCTWQVDGKLKRTLSIHLHFINLELCFCCLRFFLSLLLCTNSEDAHANEMLKLQLSSYHWAPLYTSLYLVRWNWALSFRNTLLMRLAIRFDLPNQTRLHLFYFRIICW